MRIAFILARSNDVDIYWYQPLSFGYLKVCLERHLSGVEMSYVLDDHNLRLGGYDVVCVSSLSQDFNRAKEIAQYVKSLNQEIVTIIGGQHITCFFNVLPEGFNFGVMGEGELALKNIISHLQPTSYGIYLEELLDLDTLPHPYRPSDSPPYLFTSRGCPYRCSFCSSSSFWGKPRFFSPRYVVEEIELILEQFPDIKGLSIWDDLFTIDKDRFKKIINLIDEREINKRITFIVPVRADLVTIELCEYLKTMNVKAITFGAESGSNRVLGILEKHTSVEVNQKAIDLANNYGFLVGCSFIVGVPSESEKEVRETYDFILRNMVDKKLLSLPSINILMPIPGTKMWGQAIKMGLIGDLNTFEWSRLGIFASYRDSNIADFSEWANARLRNRSIYMNEEILPHQRLLEIMWMYDEVIRSLERVYTQIN